MRISVIEPVDETTQHEYGFNLFDLNLVFVEFHIEVKPKGKRVWRLHKRWDYYSQRDSSLTEPVLPDSVREKAKLQVINMIKVNTWNEWKAKS